MNGLFSRLSVPSSKRLSIAVATSSTTSSSSTSSSFSQPHSSSPLSPCSPHRSRFHRATEALLGDVLDAIASRQDLGPAIERVQAGFPLLGDDLAGSLAQARKEGWLADYVIGLMMMARTEKPIRGGFSLLCWKLWLARPLLVAVAAALDPNARSKLVTSGFHTFRCLPLPCIEEAVNAVVSDPFTSQAVKHARLLEMIVEVDMLREKETNTGARLIIYSRLHFPYLFGFPPHQRPPQPRSRPRANSGGILLNQIASTPLPIPPQATVVRPTSPNWRRSLSATSSNESSCSSTSSNDSGMSRSSAASSLLTPAQSIILAYRETKPSAAQQVLLEYQERDVEF